MRTITTVQWINRISVAIVLVALALLLKYEGPPPQDLQFRLNVATARQAFDFTSWEIETLARKIAFGILSPQRWMDDAERSRFVLAYLDQVREASRLSDEISRAYSDPEVNDPAQTTHEQQTTLTDLRARMWRTGLVAEAILGEQVSAVLRQGGFGVLAQILPPVSGTFTPLPYMLIVSPRETIQTVYQRSLVAGLTAAEQDAIEQDLEARFPDKSCYVTAIGGLAAYPAMLLESSDIDWVSEVIAHEWTHHYLVFYPLGFYYDKSSETRTLNETAASLLGEWAGQEVILRFYAAQLQRVKPLPEALTAIKPTEPPPISPPRFDFNAVMHHTRITVDRMLAEGKIKEAEWYMEAQRRYIVANGYRLRRLNQAYFAFHGAYASSPGGGAAGEDPIGPAVRQVWAMSETPRDFLRTLSPVTTLAALGVGSRK
ncbi:MAG TPA: hypothetical protein PLJ78_01645 [Anaerolineae bacterium]|nr:hypothetical protein [Anaerolineae bacterium]HQK12626.1 hypothetical protein [Anaerolineae bacterium]